MKRPPSDGWTYWDEDGTPHRRRRNPLDAPIYDVDHMSRQEMRAIMSCYEQAKRRCDHLNRRAFPGVLTVSHMLYPMRPAYALKATAGLLRMIELRLHYHVGKEYERIYAKLPVYAQFRRFFNVKAAVESQNKKS